MKRRPWAEVLAEYAEATGQTIGTFTVAPKPITPDECVPSQLGVRVVIDELTAMQGRIWRKGLGQ